MKKILLSLGMIVFVGVVVVGVTGAFFSDTETSTGNTFTAGAIDLKVDNTSYYNGQFNATTSWFLPADLDSSHLFFNFDDLKPGDWGEDTISLHIDNNDAYACVDVTLTSDDDNGINEPEGEDGDITPGPIGGGELADAVDFAWWVDDGDNVYEEGENLLPAGPLGHLNVGETATIPLATPGNGGIFGGALTGGQTYYIGKAWCFGQFQLNPVAQDGLGYTGTQGNPQGTNGPDIRNSGLVCDGSPVNNITQTDSMTADITFYAEQSRNNESFTCRSEGGIGCSEQSDTIFVLDSSGSIDDTELGVMETAAKAFATALAPSEFGNHIGVVDFDDDAVLTQELTDILADIESAIDALSSGGATNLSAGIDVAQDELEGPNDRADGPAPDFMVIMTDGIPNLGGGEAGATTAANAAKAAGTTIYVVGIGGGVDVSFLESIATSPAHYFSSAEFSDLEAILLSLSSCTL
jgi:predicted ribosomally synthesized peptide with SipW-like signal peptide